MKKIYTTIKYLLVFLLGFITNFSGVLDNISSIPSSYKELKKVYFYTGDYLSGSWSNDTEYLLGSGDLNISEGPVILMNIDINEHDEVNGEILSESICDALPLTWIISVDSPEPGVLSFFKKRLFYVKQLKNNEMEVVAVLEMDFLDERKGIISLTKKHDPLNMLPENIVLGKNLPKFDENFEELSSYCSESPKRFREKLRGRREQTSPQIRQPVNSFPCTYCQQNVNTIEKHSLSNAKNDSPNHLIANQKQ